MTRNLSNWSQIVSQKRRMVLLGGVILLALLPGLRAQTPVYAYSQYWGVNGWVTAPYLPETSLQISSTGNLVNVSWPDWATNAAVLQTTTNLSPESEWTTLPNQPVDSAVYSGLYYTTSYNPSVILQPQFDQQYFRLMGVSTVRLPIFEFAIFHNFQMEFTQTAPLTIRGRTHANGLICLGAASGNTLRFMETVTTASSIVYSNMGGYSNFAVPVYEGAPTNRTGTPTLRLPIGTNNTAAAMREIINLPPVGESPSSSMGQQRFYNKAGVVLLISNSTVTLNVKDLGTIGGFITNIAYASATPTTTERTNLVRTLPFLTLTNRFYDFRESKWVMPTQIDMGILKTWLTTNVMVQTTFPSFAGMFPTIMYVADFRSITNLHAVRLMNGAIVPTNGFSVATSRGFTVATINPLYVWGHYNCPDASQRGTANVSATYPAALIADAITVLSPSWNDTTYSFGTLGSRPASSTTINAAMIAGTVFTTGPEVGNWSGGMLNMTRLLESWSGVTLTLNSSLVVLYNSARATNQFRNPGNYYDAPTRNFNFNTNYLIEAKLPPGTPVVVGYTPPE